MASVLDQFRGRAWSQIIVRPKLKDSQPNPDEPCIDLLRCRHCHRIVKSGFADIHLKKCEIWVSKLPENYTVNPNPSSGTRTIAKHYYLVKPTDHSSNPELNGNVVLEPAHKKRKLNKRAQSQDIILPPSLRDNSSHPSSKEASLYTELFPRKLIKSQDDSPSVDSVNNKKRTKKRKIRWKRSISSSSAKKIGSLSSSSTGTVSGSGAVNAGTTATVVVHAREGTKTLCASSDRESRSKFSAHSSDSQLTTSSTPSSSSNSNSNNRNRDRNRNQLVPSSSSTSTSASSSSTSPRNSQQKESKESSTSKSRVSSCYLLMNAWQYEDKRIATDVRSMCDLMERNLQKAWGSYAGFLDQYADEATSRNDMRRLQQLRGNLQNNQWALLTMQFLRNPRFKEGGAGFEDYFAVNDLVNMSYNIPRRFSNGSRMAMSEPVRLSIENDTLKAKQLQREQEYMVKEQPFQRFFKYLGCDELDKMHRDLWEQKFRRDQLRIKLMTQQRQKHLEQIARQKAVQATNAGYNGPIPLMQSSKKQDINKQQIRNSINGGTYGNHNGGIPPTQSMMNGVARKGVKGIKGVKGPPQSMQNGNTNIHHSPSRGHNASSLMQTMSYYHPSQVNSNRNRRGHHPSHQQQNGQNMAAMRGTAGSNHSSPTAPTGSTHTPPFHRTPSNQQLRSVQNRSTPRRNQQSQHPSHLRSGHPVQSQSHSQQNGGSHINNNSIGSTPSSFSNTPSTGHSMAYSRRVMQHNQAMGTLYDPQSIQSNNPTMRGQHHSTPSASTTNHNVNHRNYHSNSFTNNMNGLQGMNMNHNQMSHSNAVANGNPSPASIGSNHTQRSTTPRSQSGLYPPINSNNSNQSSRGGSVSGRNAAPSADNPAIFMPSIGC